jgi:hypothetical protein
VGGGSIACPDSSGQNKIELWLAFFSQNMEVELAEQSAGLDLVMQ